MKDGTMVFHVLVLLITILLASSARNESARRAMKQILSASM